MLGFLLYLLLLTGARNETIRTIEFTQFKKDAKDKTYYVDLYASKT